MLSHQTAFSADLKPSPHLTPFLMALLKVWVLPWEDEEIGLRGIYAKGIFMFTFVLRLYILYHIYSNGGVHSVYNGLKMLHH